jgi:hypothetical protein
LKDDVENPQDHFEKTPTTHFGVILACAGVTKAVDFRIDHRRPDRDSNEWNAGTTSSIGFKIGFRLTLRAGQPGGNTL